MWTRLGRPGGRLPRYTRPSLGFRGRHKNYLTDYVAFRKNVCDMNGFPCRGKWAPVMVPCKGYALGSETKQTCATADGRALGPAALCARSTVENMHIVCYTLRAHAWHPHGAGEATSVTVDAGASRRGIGSCDASPRPPLHWRCVDNFADRYTVLLYTED